MDKCLHCTGYCTHTYLKNKYNNVEKQDVEKLFEKQTQLQLAMTDSNGHCCTITKIRYHNNDVFKIIKYGEISYYVINSRKFLGSGCYGYVYEGFEIPGKSSTKKKIVGKYGEIGANEVACLKQTGLYIASYIQNEMPGIVLMYLAPGRNFEKILKDKNISDHKKIQFHK